MIVTILGFVLLLIGMPIAVTIIIVSLLYIAFFTTIDPIIGAQRVATGIDTFSLLAIPFFMLAGNLMNTAGVTNRIFKLAKVLVGHIPGSLGHVNVLASMVFAGMSGSAVADAAGLGVIEIRAMTEDGYDRDFSAAITAASSTIGPIIPPSISFVVYGLVAGVSIGGLFLAGLIPGILMGLSLMTVVFIISVKRKYRVYPRAKIREMAEALWAALPALFAPILVVGGIVSGIFTPTESGAFAVLYTLVLGFVYKEIKVRDVPKIILDTALTSGNTLFIIAVTGFLGWILSMRQVPLHMAEWMTRISPNTFVFLLLLNGILLVLGCFMAAQPIIIMLTPIILPAALIMGVDPMHLGVVMVFNLMMGLLTPPVGLSLYIVSDIAEVPVMKVFRALVPFLIPLLSVLLLITYFPEIPMFLPRLLGYAK